VSLLRAFRALVPRPHPHPAWGLGRSREWAEWSANNIIFFMSGMVMAVKLTDRRLDRFHASDWAYALLLWLLLLAIRTAATFALLPLLRRGAHPLTAKDAILISWAGLRRAVGLALAVIVYEDESAFGDLVLFFVSFVALATLIVQGSTTGWFLGRLGYTQLSASQHLAMVKSAETVEALGIRGYGHAAGPHSLLGPRGLERIQDLTRLSICEKVNQRPVGSFAGAFHRGCE
jgi:hypothetical protein